ncbi:MAG TPA: hypothetical protein VEL75_12215 [Candidatus Methylomirabilis sp.]|nr:hypothetical protein [Candidatus Methylomirabilis sp.]
MTLDDLRRWLVPRVVLPVGARLGQRMWTEARRLDRLQWRSSQEIEALSMERLRRVVAHAGEHVPFYRERLDRCGVRAGDLRSRADLWRLPVVTKAELRSRFPEGTTADDLPAERRQPMATSGSTGMPFEFYWDRAAGDLVRGAYLFSLAWAGVAVTDARIVIASPSYFYNHVAPASRFRRLAGRLVLGEESVSLSADTLTTARFRALVSEVCGRKRYFIRGYPAPIARLAARLLEEGGALAGYPEVVITFAETLTPANAATIAEALRCRAVNYYSSWEVPQMAQSCPDNPGVLHVNSDRVILRVVREDGTDAAPGETGRVVVTDLANHVMPFINYGNGDRAVAGEPCPCGRGLPTLARLEGRDAEVLRNPQGREVNGVVLGQFLAFVAGVIPYVLEYQAVQAAPDSVRLQVVPTARFSTAFAGKLRAELEEFLGPGVTVAVEPVDHIPLEASGKRLIVKQLATPAPV